MNMEQERMFWTETLNRIVANEKGFAYMLAFGTSELNSSLELDFYDGDGISMRSGASKLCILAEGHDTVLKIPFDADDTDYCKVEADNFADALAGGLDKYFAAVHHLMDFPYDFELDMPVDEDGEINYDDYAIARILNEEEELDFQITKKKLTGSTPCYVAQRMEVDFDEAISSDVYSKSNELSQERINSVQSEHCCSSVGLYERDVRIALMFQAQYGDDATKELNTFLIAHNVNDLHTSNVMFDSNYVPHIIDYSGFGSW